MTKASFRNAPVAALIYEFLYDAYSMIRVDRSHLCWLWDEKTTPLGVFDHGFTSKWEWSASILTEVGAIIPIEPPDLAALRGDAQRIVSTPFYTPAMTLKACHETDFSSFETFDNYCYAMFTLDQHVADDDHLSFTSPRFLEAVAARDDIFEVDAFCRVTYSRDRFNEKVMTRWDEMQVREFKAT